MKFWYLLGEVLLFAFFFLGGGSTAKQSMNVFNHLVAHKGPESYYRGPESYYIQYM